MLNCKALTDVLTNSSDEHAGKRLFLITRNGTLLAYSQPANIKDLRKQAALAALSWQEHTRSPEPRTGDYGNGPNEIVSGSLHTLIIESEISDLIVRNIQPGLLLVSESNVPPRTVDFEPHITAERFDGTPTQTQNGGAESSNGSSDSSRVQGIESTSASGILGPQRQQLDTLASALTRAFEDTGFTMPDDIGIKIF